MKHTETSLRGIMESLVRSGHSPEEVIMGFSTAEMRQADDDLKRMRRYFQRKQYEESRKGTPEWRRRRQQITKNYRNRHKLVDATAEML